MQFQRHKELVTVYDTVKSREGRMECLSPWSSLTARGPGLWGARGPFVTTCRGAGPSWGAGAHPRCTLSFIRPFLGRFSPICSSTASGSTTISLSLLRHTVWPSFSFQRETEVCNYLSLKELENINKTERKIF